MAAMVESSHTANYSPKYHRFSMPGSLTIQEELEEVHSRDSIASTSTLIHSRKESSKMLSPEARLKPGSNSRRISSVSTSSTRSYSEGETPTMASIGALANERENMKTPRPRTMESPKSQRVLLPDVAAHPAAFVNNRKEASDATLEANDPNHRRMGTDQSALFDNQPREYPSDSLGKYSIASSGYGTRSGSEAANEFGERNSSSAIRKNRKKPVAPPELLVIVRPPPSKQANPLNLQIQLVIPQALTASSNSRTSLDSSRDEASISASQSSSSNGANNSPNALSTPNSHGIKRSASMSSSHSARSEASSGAFSTTSSSSQGRRVTPLYNLNFHNITATTVTDAGTDDKVAKFGKKAVEIDGFGQLEPHELMKGVNDLSSLQARRRSSTRAALPAPTGLSSNSGSDLNSPDALSDVSQAKSTELTHPPSRTSDVGAIRPVDEPPTSFDAMSPEAKNPGEGGLGGKLLSRFKRFSIGASANAQAKLGSMGAPSTRSSTTAPDSATSMAPASLLAKMTSKVKDGVDGPTEDSEVMSTRESSGIHSLGHALGFDIPQLIAGGGLRSDGRRTEGYFWTVRKWNRRSAQDFDDEEGRGLAMEEAGMNPILNSVWKRFNIVNRMGGQEIHPPCKEVPVRFEWTRNAGLEQRRKSSVVSGHARSATDFSQKNRSNRLSVSRAARPTIEAKAGAETSTTTESGENEKGSLKLPKGGRGSRPSSVYSNASPRRSMDVASQTGSHVGSIDNGEDSDPEDSETTWSCHLVLGPATRIPIGSLSPTPHHPKLVGQLTIPFPLPDLSQSGLGADGAGLTREELKDIISVTCLFVIVREGFGGLVKKK